MPSQVKPAASVSTKRISKPAPKIPAKPFLRFHHSQELRKKTINALESVESAEKPSTHAEKLTELILELVDSGLKEFFLQPLKTTKASFLVQQSAALGLSGVQKVMGTVIRNILGRMDDKQILSVCTSIRQFMV